MQEAFITVEHLSKSYKRGTIKAVDDATFSVGKGEVFGLIGPNGAGKTTIMGCLLALLEVSAGRILIDGKSPFDLGVKRMTGFLPERPCYNRGMTVYDFLRYHHMLAEQPESSAGENIKRVLELVELEIDPMKRRIRELSRGMLQRVGLAQAFIGNPSVCFFDEPTSGMDPLGFILMRKLLMKCKNDGITVILNSHHLHEVEKVCDKVAFIRRGRIESVESVDTIAQVRQVLAVKWTGDNLSADAKLEEELQNIAAQADSALIDFDGEQARFTAPDKEVANRILASLVKHDIAVYEAHFEKRELVDLFLRDTVDNTECGSDTANDTDDSTKGNTANEEPGI